MPAWQTMLTAPLPNAVVATPNVPAVVAPLEIDADPGGQTGLYSTTGATVTATNPFFQSLGSNGRACVTCHVPANAMGLSLANIQSRFNAGSTHDPLFAPVDAATCPKNVPAASTSRSLLGGLFGTGSPLAAAGAYSALLTKGLFRISLPVPTNAQFTIKVVSDPYGCNTDPHYNQVTNSSGTLEQLISVYRRPLISANLKYKVLSAANTGAFPPIDPLTGAKLPLDAQGNLENGSIMSDGREPTLSSQAIDAVLTHAQGLKPPTAAQVAQIVQYESNIYVAQTTDTLAGSLTSGVAGGPVNLSADPAATDPAPGAPVMTLYNGWAASKAAMQASVYRGQELFNNRSFTISNVAGVNNIPGLGNSPQFSCAGCHSQVNVGANALPVAQIDEGIGGDLPNHGGPLPAADLPIFELTCTGGHSTPFNGAQVRTNDPGKALITGLCSDIGRFTIPTLRGLAARPPYFSDGSAPGLGEVVTFYNRRFNIGLSPQEMQDMVNFLRAL
jgi:cytochrome c peroxidase